MGLVEFPQLGLPPYKRLGAIRAKTKLAKMSFGKFDFGKMIRRRGN